MSICLPKHTNTQPAYPLFPQHFQHELAEATNLVATVGLQGGDNTLLRQKKVRTTESAGLPTACAC